MGGLGEEETTCFDGEREEESVCLAKSVESVGETGKGCVQEDPVGVSGGSAEDGVVCGEVEGGFSSMSNGR